MYEKDVNNIFTLFLEKQGKKFKIPKKSAPDLLINDTAVEIEGSWVNFKVALEKYVKYSLEYSSLEIVFPTDALDVNKMFQLLLLEKLLEKKSRPPIKIHLVTELERHDFVLKTFQTVQELYDTTVNKTLDILESSKDLPKDEKSEKIFLTLISADEEIKNILIEETKSSENKISI
ncbi:MAG: hypothetical protein ACUVXA_18725 [Candidatus Jordarchaeum sp.]|uniref:hypothetical protein n=1 Tax=Candidatus Jordarchaeum sp. TaxID=2823881 RepID=UPI0040492D1A